jgi:hypothetical protein
VKIKDIVIIALVGVCALMATVTLVERGKAANRLQMAHRAYSKALASQQQDAHKAECDAFVNGILLCQQQDIDFLKSLQKEAAYQRDHTKSVVTYVQMKYLTSFLKWAINGWAYTDKQLQNMLDEWWNNQGPQGV